MELLYVYHYRRYVCVSLDLQWMTSAARTTEGVNRFVAMARAAMRHVRATEASHYTTPLTVKVPGTPKKVYKLSTSDVMIVSFRRQRMRGGERRM